MSYRKKKRFPNGRADPQQTTLTGMNANLQSTEELLSTGELYSGQPYQRPVNDSAVDKLVREWDPRLWSAIGRAAITWWTASTASAPCGRKTTARM